MVAKWDILKRRIKRNRILTTACVSIDISSDGKVLVCGGIYGEVFFLNPEDLENIRENFEPGEELESEVGCLKFSPKNDLLFVAYSEKFTVNIFFFIIISILIYL